MRFRAVFLQFFLIAALALRSTVAAVSHSCTGDYYQCADGKCIFKEWLCDFQDDCDDHSDETDCPAPATCGPNDFTCVEDASCITGSWRCDGEFDCTDNSDETNCSCTSTQWRCPSGLCISISWRCDGDNDCGDGADEDGCSSQTPTRQPCKSYEFECDNNNCIPAEWTCDTHDDCGDDSDEADELCLSDRTCQSEQFTCDSGQCTFLSWLCDGENDCEDNSDEKSCATPSVTATPTQDPCPGGFECADTQDCIFQSWKCDAEPDCYDSSDEKNCSTCPLGFLCDSDEHCIAEHHRCDNETDCKNGEDEQNCTTKETPTVPPCLSPKFRCSNGICLAETHVCDSVDDCSDGADEAGCDDECAKLTHDCARNEVCFDQKRGFRCECKKGYKRDPVTGSCHVQCNETECDQICISKQTSYKCECYPDFELVHDAECKLTGPDPYLFYVYNQAILRIGLTSQIERVAVPNLRSPVALDYNYDEQVVYYSDNFEHKIFVAKMSGSETPEVLVEGDGMDGPDDLAYDWINKYLFWTDGPRETVERYDFRSKERIVLFNDSLDEPRAIVVHPFEGSGHIYFADWGNPARIEKATVDGKDRQTLVSKDIVWPNGLTLDLYRSHLYWSDAKLDYIKRMDLDGSHVEKILLSEGIHPHTLTFFDRELFWTDWEQKGILKQSKSLYAFVKQGLTAASPLGIKTVHPHRQPTMQDFIPCVVKNGGCSHVCKNVNFKAECDCPDGYRLWTDHKACLVSLTQCPTEYTFCHNGGTCFETPTEVKCSCDEDHSGPRCGDLVHASTPCEVNKGGCSDICENGERQAICKCNESRNLLEDGKTCLPSSIQCPDYCVNGSCSQGNRGPACECDTGYQGLRCDVKVPDKPEFVPCQVYCANGTCFDTRNGTECICNPGYQGSTCETKVPTTATPRKSSGTYKVPTTATFRKSSDNSVVGIAVGAVCGVIVIVVIIIIILWLLKRNSMKGEVHFENPVYTNTSDNVTLSKEPQSKDQNNGAGDSKHPGTYI